MRSILNSHLFLQRARFLLNGFWALPVVIIIFVISPIIKIHFFPLNSVRIGHFVADSIHFLIYARSTPNELFFFWYPKPSANKFWEKYLSRNLNIFQPFKYVTFYQEKIFGRSYHYDEIISQSRDLRGDFALSKNIPGFTDHEDNFAYNWLKIHGWKPGQEIVCLMVRDSQYLDSLQGKNSIDFSYHDYRDSDIKSYRKSVEYLLSQNYFVIRMGKVMKTQLYLEHESFIDYPFLETKDDLMDVWLLANCNLCISTLFGPDEICGVFKTKCLFINHLPIAGLPSYVDGCHAPKVLRWSHSKKNLSLNESIENSYVHAHEYKENNIEIIDLNELEIEKIVKEMILNIKQSYNPSLGKKNLQFKEMFFSSTACMKDKNYNFKSLHGYVHPKFHMSEIWLEKMGEEFYLK
jgi:putative glycosyltransferase (TIGR04372 family)